MNVDGVKVVAKDAGGPASAKNILDHGNDPVIDFLDLLRVFQMFAPMHVLDRDQADEGLVGVVILERLFDKISQRFLGFERLEAKSASIALTDEYALSSTAVNTPSLSPK